MPNDQPPIVSVIPWSSTTLCNLDDIRKDVRQLRIPFMADPSDQDFVSAMSDYIDSAKDEIADVMMLDLQKIYKTSITMYGSSYSWNAWLGFMGYTMDTLDHVLDRIGNPEVLRRTASMCTLKLALFNAEFSFHATYQANSETISHLYKLCEKAYRDRYAIAVQKLWLDLNLSGVVEPQERLINQATVWRT